MRTRSDRKNKIHIITLGCSKNIYDSEILMGQLNANNLEVSHEDVESNANIVVINTCGFIENAKQQSIDTILEQVERKKLGEIDKLFVTGCLSERYKPDLEKSISNVNKYFGTKDLPNLLKALGADYKHELLGQRLLTTPSHYSFLKISEGCNRKCSFCAIPLMRGRHISKSIEELLLETKKLAKNGVKEVILIAQDLTYYGIDIYKERKLGSLLNELSKVDGIEWIRLHYAFPTGFPEEILSVIRKNKKICNYLDIPLQHISDSVLSSMRRGTNASKTNKLIKSIRKEIPGVAIRTSLIVGYPNETEKDFEKLKKWVVKMRFDRLGVFTYSHEEDTYAHNLEDVVPQEIKKKRADELMKLQSNISLELNQQKIGKILKVLFDRIEGDYFIGRTEFDSPDVDNEVKVLKKDLYLRLGEFAKVCIIKADHYDLYGKVIE